MGSGRVRDARFPSMDETGVPVIGTSVRYPRLVRGRRGRPAVLLRDDPGRSAYATDTAARKTEGRHDYAAALPARDQPTIGHPQNRASRALPRPPRG